MTPQSQRETTTPMAEPMQSDMWICGECGVQMEDEWHCGEHGALGAKHDGVKHPCDCEGDQ